MIVDQLLDVELAVQIRDLLLADPALDHLTAVFQAGGHVHAANG